MIRPLTCLSLVLALISGLYLYQEKHRTALLDRELGRVIAQTDAARAQTGVLQAEWALMNGTGRLADLAARYLQLQPLAPTQFVQVAALDDRLPAAQPAPAGGATDDDEAVADAAPAGPAPAMPVAAMPAPAMLASAPLAMVQPPHHAQMDATPPASPAPTASRPERKYAARAVPPARPDRPVAFAANRPFGAPVLSAIARPRPSLPSREIAALPVSSTAYVGSSLGGRTSLPPPVPLGPGER